MKEADMNYDGFGGMDEAGQNGAESVHEAEGKRDRIQSAVGAEANGIGNTIGMEIAGIGSASGAEMGGVDGAVGMSGGEFAGADSMSGVEFAGAGSMPGIGFAGIGSAASMGFGGIAGINGMTGEETFWGLPVAFAMEEEARDRIGNMTDEQREVLRQKSTGLTDDSQIEELVRMVAEGKFE